MKLGLRAIIAAAGRRHYEKRVERKGQELLSIVAGLLGKNVNGPASQKRRRLKDRTDPEQTGHLAVKGHNDQPSHDHERQERGAKAQ